VIAGELEALAHRADAAGDAAGRDAERARLERELEDARGWLAAARARLANEAFISKAPPTVVEGARAREAELADQVGRLEDRLADLGS
jgi:valyl-tRNA synthetase